MGTKLNVTQEVSRTLNCRKGMLRITPKKIVRPGIPGGPDRQKKEGGRKETGGKKIGGPRILYGFGTKPTQQTTEKIRYRLPPKRGKRLVSIRMEQ